MKTLNLILCMWHEWRAAVWASRIENPPLSEETSMHAWERYWRAAELMRKYHARRHDLLVDYMRLTMLKPEKLS